MPALTVTVADMAAALTRVAGPQVSALIDWVPDPIITRMFATSPAKAVGALLCAATASDQAWGGRTALTMPALTVTVAQMAAALTRVAGPQVSALIDWVPDPMISRMFATWPARIRAARAARLGLTPDPDFDSVIRMYLAE